MDPICQTKLPHLPWMDPATARLPGVQPLGPGDSWLMRDDAFAAQMALRDRLVAERRGAVIAALPGSEAAVEALYVEVLYRLAADPGYDWGEGAVRRPDGVVVPLDPADRLGTLARLVQEDLCLLEPRDGEHVMTAAILCFPASWTLAEKIGRPLTGIHSPVALYDAGMAARVQRLFDMVRPERPLWRQNALVYADAALHQPRPEAAPRREAGAEGRYLRSEKQCLVRLPSCDAVLFAIHTFVVQLSAIPPEALRQMPHRAPVT
ncbi:heme-dependent oxidative N-demethylase family protein [Roseicyclus mahoneyensis]|uniref:Uncharacterized protein DUF3445 n=1 Tax=Roseicyclus mahoneyensis TaxID=164332 RepID=A0A316GP88_9RHOB|nr:DUF3445 domain-containing protein [Roseicyclus mahoneyensis]PWK62845.1 uncharacterized protein DUF3445 [Roseicyclus mahoneyensis]